MKIEPYDVTFENFTPDCGMALYQDIEDVMLPYRRKDLAEIKGKVDRLRSELELLNSLDSDVRQIQKGAKGLSAKLDSDSGQKIRSLLLVESEGTEPAVGRTEAVNGFITWIRECQGRKSDFDGLLSAAKAKVESAIEDEPPLTVREGKMIRLGYNAEVDELRYEMEHGGEHIAQVEAAERERTGIPKLKVGYNRVFGYYIEVTKSLVDYNYDPAAMEAHRRALAQALAKLGPKDECKREMAR